MKTILSKSIRGGYQAESMTETDANGQAWQITTSKRSNGLVSCSAIQGDDKGEGIFSYEMFGAKRLQLASEKTNGTEAAIKRVHAAGLIEFERIQKETATEAPAKPLYVVGIGQIIFTDGFDTQSKRVIYEIVRPGNFKTVTLDGKELRHDDHVRPYSDKFGIGTYYNEGETLPLEEVNNLVNQARQATEERHAAEERASEQAAKERARKIEEGKKIIPAIPAGVKAVIMGIRFSTTYDPNADYCGHQDHTEEVIYLAFSGHEKDLFSEMRKAADKNERTAHLGTGKNIFSAYQINTSETPFTLGGDHQHPGCSVRWTEKSPEFFTRAEVEKWISEQGEPATRTADDGREIKYIWHIEEDSIEHREKYSMGSGYYMKSGEWKIRKSNIDASSLPNLQIAAAEGRFFCNTQPETTTEAPNLEPVEVKAGTVQIIEYGRGLAIIGDTRPIAEKLGKKGLGLIFQPRLSCGPGWIAPKSRLEEIQKALSKPATVEAPEANTYPTDKAQELAELPKVAGFNPDSQKFELITAPDPDSIPDEPTAEEAQQIEDTTAQMIEETTEQAKRGSALPMHAPGFAHRWPPAPASIEARRIESDQRKAGKSNTALPAPQMFLSF